MKWVFLPTTFLSTILLLFHILISKRVGITNNFSSKQEGVLYKEVNLKELSDKIQNKTNPLGFTSPADPQKNDPYLPQEKGSIS